MTRRQSITGFTLTELIIVVLVVFAIFVTALILFNSGGPSRATARRVKDSTQVRGIHQGMLMGAQSNNDEYLTPAHIDKQDTTIPGDPDSKNTSANILSVHIYNGYFPPELCISPSEVNRAIRVMRNYSYSDPKLAAKPAHALWDPAFSVDFTSGKTGNLSYAHMPPMGPRKARWTNTFDATEPIIGNRGPRVSSVSYGTDPTTAFAAFDRNSNTLAIHGAKNTWEGNTVYNDNHVNFETRMDPPPVVYPDSAGKLWADCLFFDEPNDVNGQNALLSIWTKAGPSPADFVSIWD